MELTVSTRDRLVQLLTSEFTIPDELVDCVKFSSFFHFTITTFRKYVIILVII